MPYPASKAIGDDETVFDVALDHPVMASSILWAGIRLDIRDDAALGAEIEHLLVSLDAADQEAGD